MNKIGRCEWCDIALIGNKDHIAYVKEIKNKITGKIPRLCHNCMREFENNICEVHDMSYWRTCDECSKEIKTGDRYKKFGSGKIWIRLS